MRVLVTGVKGQLGYDIVRVCQEEGIEAIGVDIEEMDITDCEAVAKVIGQSGADAVIHCSAYTAVDKAEEDIDTCNKVNVEGTRNIALVCRELNIKMMYFSTDYVFDGQGEKPWQVDDAPSPINVYGQSKYLGEQEVRNLVKEHFIIRISWVFGINGNNFVKTMLRLGNERDELNVVDDQIGAPTYTYDLARLAVAMIQSDKYGTYHVTNEGDTSWYEFAKEIFFQAGVEVKVNPVSSSEFKSAAKRPSNSKMDKSRLDEAGFGRLPSWQDALKRYLVELQ
ncbi:MAG: dTDP-4-dehydrorhamnose reductase [Erysipelotrichaceae bacterium]|nr:dTDP-4-dehydrorhamnose reductase [Erysipelotrichaceae bacterium]MDD3809852.1 dTDP-4-dehydrorhamnose reductase [Erysipelotrichaceae bacterium]